MDEININRIKNAIYQRKMAQRENNNNERTITNRNQVLRRKFISISKTAHTISDLINAEFSYSTYHLHVLYSQYKPRLTISVVDKSCPKPIEHLASLTFTAFLLNTITVTISTSYKSTMSRKIIIKVSNLEALIEDYIVTFYSEFIEKY